MSSGSSDEGTGPTFGPQRTSLLDGAPNWLAADPSLGGRILAGLKTAQAASVELIETLAGTPRFVAAQLHADEAVLYAPLTTEQHLALPHHA